MSINQLSTITVDPESILLQLQLQLQSSNGVWADLLTSGVGETILEFIAAVGSYDQYAIRQAYLNLFNDTARLDSAIYANTKQAGVRLRRKMPAGVSVTLTNTTISPITIHAYQNQFGISSYSLFLRTNVTIAANSSATITLNEGVLTGSSPSYNSTVYYLGSGGDFQSLVMQEDSFTISDVDVVVNLNSSNVPVETIGMWNFKSAAACQDLTTRDGRLQILFGNSGPTGTVGLVSAYGTVPNAGDTIQLLYVVTQGDKANDISVASSNPNQLSGLPTGISCTAINSGLVGGLAEVSASIYKTVGPQLFAAHDVCIRQQDYNSNILTYLGGSSLATIAPQNGVPILGDYYNNIKVADSYIQGQADLNPNNLTFSNYALIWMVYTDNTGVVSEDMINAFPAIATDFKTWLQTRSMFSMRYNFDETLQGVLPTSSIPTQYITKPPAYPFPIIIDITANVGCFSYANLGSVQSKIEANLAAYFTARPGIINHDIYLGDIAKIIQVTDQSIDYVQLLSPNDDMIINIKTLELSATFTTNVSGLPSGSYTYLITAVYMYDGVHTYESAPVSTIPLNSSRFGNYTLTWANMAGAIGYNIYRSRSSGWYLIGSAIPLTNTVTLPAGTLTLTDNNITGVATAAGIPNTGLPTSGIIDVSGVRYPVLGNVTLNMVYTQRNYI